MIPAIWTARLAPLVTLCNIVRGVFHPVCVHQDWQVLEHLLAHASTTRNMEDRAKLHAKYERIAIAVLTAHNILAIGVLVLYPHHRHLELAHRM